MGMRNRDRETLNRLMGKTLEARFLREVGQGLNCSPFEAQAVLQVVKEVYFPFLDDAGGRPPPGKVTLVAVSADEPAGKSVQDCQKVTVCLTLHRGRQDDQVMHRDGARAFRLGRIGDLCQEALSQGALLTADDLAYRVFFVSPRTITRDLQSLRRQEPQRLIPMRSTMHDLGPVLTHRTEIVRLALEGKTTSQICQIMRHSPQAVGNYLATFERCAVLADQGMQAGQIAFLLRRGKGLIAKYLELLEQCKSDRNMRYHLKELLRLGQAGGKKPARGGRAHG